VGCKPEESEHLEVAILRVARKDASYEEPDQQYLLCVFLPKPAKM
jgi:hypothetical protein